MINHYHNNGMIYAIIDKWNINWRRASKGVLPVLCWVRVEQGGAMEKVAFYTWGGTSLIDQWEDGQTSPPCTNWPSFIWHWFFLKKGAEKQKFCKNFIQLCLLLIFKTQCFKLTLLAIFVNNLHANVVIFCKYILLNFCNPKLIWKNRRLISSK